MLKNILFLYVTNYQLMYSVSNDKIFCGSCSTNKKGEVYEYMYVPRIHIFVC